MARKRRFQFSWRSRGNNAALHDGSNEARAYYAAVQTSAYRYFPNGVESLVDFFHRTTLLAIVSGVKNRTCKLPTSVEFRVAVDEGVRGGLDALASVPWTSEILPRNRDMLTGYLLSRDPGGILGVLSDYAARCAANFGSDADELHTKAEVTKAAVQAIE